jgi:hypothetical protein
VTPFDSAKFFVGANLPWLHYGIDFGANAWQPEGGVARPDQLTELNQTFETLAASGVTAVRWFLFCDGRAGIDFATTGRPQRLDAFVLRDIDAALKAAQRFNLQIMFVLLDFVWCDPARIVKGVQLGGRSAVLHEAEARRALLDKVLRPVLKHYAREPGILAWDIMNEPEWIRSLTLEQLHAFLGEAVDLAHAHATQPVTVGSAGVRWRSLYQGLGLDFYQVHWYDSLTGQPALETPVAELGFDKPVVLGEFPTLGSRRPMSQILDVAHASGYAAAFYWSACAGDGASDGEAAVETARRWLA